MSKPGSRAGSVSDALKNVVLPKKKGSVAPVDPEPGHRNYPQEDLREEKPEKPGCFKSVSKSLLRILYTLLCLGALFFGLAALVISSSELVTLKLFKGPTLTQGAAYVLIIAVLVALVGLIVAVVGIWLKNRKVLYGAAGLLVALAVIQLIALFVAQHNYSKNEEKYLTVLFQKSVKQHHKESTQEYNHIENTFECCGLNSFEDYPKVLTPTRSATYLVSSGCCPNYDSKDTAVLSRQKTSQCINSEKFYREGCSAKTAQATENYKKVVISLVVIFVILELAVAVFALPKFCKREEPKPEPNN